jgi:WD40 repeat protein
MRGFLITIVLGVAIFLGLAWYMEFPPFSPQSAGTTHPDEMSSPEKVERKLGALLYTPVKLETPKAVVTQYKDPIVVEGHNTIVDKQEVPSKRSGQLLFIGQEVEEGKADVSGAIMTAPVTQVTREMGKDGKEVVVSKKVMIRYRPLEEGDRVKQGDMVAMLDYSQALTEWMSKKAKVDAAKADYDSSGKKTLEARARLDRLDRMRLESASKIIVAPEEYSGAKYTLDASRFEEEGKRAAVYQSEIDAHEAQIIYEDHMIRARLPGTSIIKVIYKKTGEMVKEQEPQILQLFNIDRLRAEGLVEVQYLNQLKLGMKASLEPIEEEGPQRVLDAHRKEVTSVAVSPDGNNPLIVSASRDNSVRVWSRSLAGVQRVYEHPSEVRTLACSTPPGSKQRWLLTGCADGSLRLFDLAQNSDQPIWDSTKKTDQQNPHVSAITALAFSPDGKYFATGGEDNTMALWETANGKLKYPFDAEHGVDNPHQDSITALHFTPQCTLVSASRDQTLRIWELRQNGAHELGDPITGRGGSVADLGVSQDGKWALLEKGKELQILSLADRREYGEIKNHSGATPFETVAVFSPNSHLLMTAGGAEGRLQLWRAPTDGKRGFELRQLAPLKGDHSPVTCAAFSPDGTFAVSGSKEGYVYIWDVPNQDKIDHHRMEGLKLTLIERVSEANTRQARIGVNVQNPMNAEYPEGRLIPGRPIRIVIEPE